MNKSSETAKHSELYSPRPFSPWQAVGIIASVIFVLGFLIYWVNNPKIILQPIGFIGLVFLAVMIVFITLRENSRFELGLQEFENFLKHINFKEVSGNKRHISSFISVSLFNPRKWNVLPKIIYRPAKYYRGEISNCEVLLVHGIIQTLFNLDYIEYLRYYLSYAVQLPKKIRGEMYLENNKKTVFIPGVRPYFVRKRMQQRGDVKYFIDSPDINALIFEPLIKWYEKLKRPPLVVLQQNQLLFVYYPQIMISETEIMNSEAASHQEEEIKQLLSFFNTAQNK